MRKGGDRPSRREGDGGGDSRRERREGRRRGGLVGGKGQELNTGDIT